MKRLLIVLLALLCIPPAQAVRHARGSVSASALFIPAVNNLPNNWPNVGLLPSGGIAAIDAARSTCSTSVTPSGKTPPTSGDDVSLINTAISGCATNSVLTLGNSSCTCASPCVFQFDQSEYIAENKNILIKVYGSVCGSVTSAGSWWPVVLNVYNGAIADWTISSSTTGANCGVTHTSVSACTQATGVILMSPSTNYNWGWAGCFLGVNPTTGSCGTTLTADAAQGDTVVHVTSTSNFSVGMWVLIDESPQVTSTSNPTGGTALEATSDFLTASASPATMRLEGGDIPGAYSFIGSGGGSQQNQRLNEEIHQISAIGSGTLTFSTPLTLAFRQSGSHDARVYWPTVQGSTANPFLTNAGVENLTITKPANSGVQIQFCAGCYVYNVEVSTWIAGAVNCTYAARCDIESNYFHNGADLENNGNEYPIGISSATTECYVADNIILIGGKGMVGRAANSCVVAYNYMDDTMYMGASIGDYWNDMDVNGSHYAGTHHFLFEGNWGDNCDSDETHGNAIYHTFFRNQCTGVRTTFTDPSISKTVNDTTGSCWGNAGVSATCAPQRAAGPMAFDYWFAFAGNVLGLSGVTTTANGWVYKGAFCGGGTCSGGFTQNKAIWMSGWVGGEEPSTDPNLTTNTNPWVFRNGNYDYVNGSVVDNAGGYSQAFPNSLYTASAPSFFSKGSCTYPWPWVTPSGSSKIQTNSCSGSGLPAQARWNNGTPFTQP